MANDPELTPEQHRLATAMFGMAPPAWAENLVNQLKEKLGEGKHATLEVLKKISDVLRDNGLPSFDLDEKATKQTDHTQPAKFKSDDDEDEDDEHKTSRRSSHKSPKA